MTRACAHIRGDLDTFTGSRRSPELLRSGRGEGLCLPASRAPGAIIQHSLTLATDGSQVSLEELGSIGELVAAIATVVTLVYLAIQVRHNSRALDRSNEFPQASSGTVQAA